jgi:flagellar FliJ protein
MSRPFRLASLLHLRVMAEDRAAAELAAAARLRAAADARRHATEVMLGSASLPGHSDELHFHAAAASRAALGSLLMERRSEVQATDADVAVANAAWTAARVQTKALERLEERHDAQVREQDERAEQLVLDEVGARMRTAQLAVATAPALAPTTAPVDVTGPVRP